MPVRMKGRPISRYNGAYKTKPGGTRVLSIRLSAKDYARLANAVESSPQLTIQSFSERALLDALESMEREHGGPFPIHREKKRVQRSASRHVIDFYV